ncbi:phytanoyl-CoA dioxygenase family protein [Vineibacter terrae]|uniref:phytanoyl-CoA dioxygenase family protein n=1 Tax=Vineibacter terrae TaxID=2586908 RepID=UPI002E319231|nr:phytanoyl-CoA dioxygenase family protein [Vineibacter terrae]HEX2889737.1 phytanoyl-CoA dioxygenase family protein [Vineibacter terrae]
MSHEAALPLTDADIARYRDDGAICIRGAFAPDWIERLRAAIDADMQAPGPMVRINTPQGNPGLFFVDFQLWQRHDACRAFVFESPAADIAGRLMGASEVVYYHDHLLVKEPGTVERTPWHHDQPYYPIDGRQIVSLWLPLDAVARDVCVEYVRGSHRWGRWFAPKFFRQGGVNLQVQDPRFEDVPDIDAERSQHAFLSWDIEPGDVIAFHALTLHGAPGNRSSSRRRRAWATRWCGEDARYASRVGQISPPLDGHGLQPGDKLACDLFPRVRPISG